MTPALVQETLPTNSGGRRFAPPRPLTAPLGFVLWVLVSPSQPEPTRSVSWVRGGPQGPRPKTLT